MTLISLMTAGIPIRRRQNLPGPSWVWTWISLVAAALCVIFAPLVYCYAATEWSSFMGIVSGMVQAAITVQIAIIANSACAKAMKMD